MSTAPEDQMFLPMDLGGIDADWVTLALGHKYPGTRVSGVSVDGEIHGTASKARLNIDYESNKHELPATMYIKGGFAGEAQLELAGAEWFHETMFFRNFSPKLEGLEIPKSYFEATNAELGQSIVLLEDLTKRDVVFGNAARPVTPDTAAATLEWQAELHSRFWNNCRNQELQAWPGGLEDVIKALLSDQFWGAMIARPLANPVPERMRDPEQVLEALTAYWNIFRDYGPQTFLHGDAHLGNMYFLADGSPGFLDWQSPKRGPWSDDVSYFLIGALTVKDRREHERHLLQHYLECLRARGVDAPGFDEVWLAHRREVIRGFMWVGTPPQMQPDDIVAANTERYCAALEDLETLDALGLGRRT